MIPAIDQGLLDEIVRDVYGHATLSRSTLVDAVSLHLENVKYLEPHAMAYVRRMYRSPERSALRSMMRQDVVEAVFENYDIQYVRGAVKATREALSAPTYATFATSLVGSTRMLLQRKHAGDIDATESAKRRFIKRVSVGGWWKQEQIEKELCRFDAHIAQARLELSTLPVRAQIRAWIREYEDSTRENYVEDAIVELVRQQLPARASGILRLRGNRVERAVPPQVYYASQFREAGMTPVARTYVFGVQAAQEEVCIDPWSYRQAAYDALLTRFAQMPMNRKAAKRVDALGCVDLRDLRLPEGCWGYLTQPTRELLKSRDGTVIWPDFVRELRAHMQNRPEDAHVTRLLRILEKFNPDVYEDNIGNVRIHVSPPRDAGELKRAALSTGRVQGSCISSYELSDFGRMIDDPGTQLLVARKDGRLKGYARLFYMSEGPRPLLAIDTIELPRKDFSRHREILNALALAAIDIGIASGAHAIIGRDARINFGPKQAYGSYERNLTLEKLGFIAPVTHYEFSHLAVRKVYVLMESWKP